LLIGLCSADAAFAQIETVVVTARRQVETLQNTPVVIAVVTNDQLEKHAITDFPALAAQVPDLLINTGAEATGAQITVRGIGSPTYDAGFSQAVSTNVDGVQFSKALNVAEGFFDVQQVEVLKGPQPLYFGKNSTGGIVAFHTVDPGDKFDGMGRFQYDTSSAEYLGMAAVDVPLTDELGVRLAVQDRSASGYFTNQAAPVLTAFSNVPAPLYKNAPDLDEFIGRGTLKYDNGSNFTVRAKLGYYHLRDSGPQSNLQGVICPAANPVNSLNDPAINDCTLNHTVFLPNEDPGMVALFDSVATAGGHKEFFWPSNGAQRKTHQSWLASVEANYTFDRMVLSSLTGYYNTDTRTGVIDATRLSAYTGLPSSNFDNYRLLSEELRLTTNFGGWYDFLIGLFYSNERENIGTEDILNLTPALDVVLGLPPSTIIPDTEPIISPFLHTINTFTYSAFGQGTIRFSDQLTLLAGVRWTEERKGFSQLGTSAAVMAGTGFGTCGLVLTQQCVLPEFDFPHLQRTFYNASPEVTLNWTPADAVLIFGTFKEGFKSGGFANGLFSDPNPAHLVYRPETARGFEIGAKTLWRDYDLQVDGDVFRYDYFKLQESFELPGSTSIYTVNAPHVKTQGIELDLVWAPEQFQGLTAHASGVYDDAKFIDYTTVCYGGQTIAGGCNLTANPFVSLAGAPCTFPAPPIPCNAQSLNGKRLQQAPEFSASWGATYDHPLLANYRYSLTANFSYADGYNSNELYDPRGQQAAAFRIDAALRLYTEDDHYSLAVIGRNLTDVLRLSISHNSVFSSSFSATGTPFATPTNIEGWVEPPREVLLQAMVHF
jgi:outer membrane receptor protein involved in Fe transport